MIGPRHNARLHRCNLCNLCNAAELHQTADQNGRRLNEVSRSHDVAIKAMASELKKTRAEKRLFNVKRSDIPTVVEYLGGHDQDFSNTLEMLAAIIHDVCDPLTTTDQTGSHAVRMSIGATALLHFWFSPSRDEKLRSIRTDLARAHTGVLGKDVTGSSIRQYEDSVIKVVVAEIVARSSKRPRPDTDDSLDTARLLQLRDHLEYFASSMLMCEREHKVNLYPNCLERYEGSQPPTDLELVTIYQPLLESAALAAVTTDMLESTLYGGAPSLAIVRAVRYAVILGHPRMLAEVYAFMQAAHGGRLWHYPDDASAYRELCVEFSDALYQFPAGPATIRDQAREAAGCQHCEGRCYLHHARRSAQTLIRSIGLFLSGDMDLPSVEKACRRLRPIRPPQVSEPTWATRLAE